MTTLDPPHQTAEDLRAKSGSSLLLLFLAHRDHRNAPAEFRLVCAEIDRRFPPDVMVTMNSPQVVADTERALGR